MSRMELSLEEQQQWDVPLIALAQKSNGDLRLLLKMFFSFLHRKTDFYMLKDTDSGTMGFPNGHAEQLLLASFRQFPLRKLQSSSVATNKERTATATATAVTKSTTVAATKSTDKNDNKTKGDTTKEEEQQQAVRYTKDKKQIPVGNGGTSVYEDTTVQWTQTLTEVTALIPLSQKLRAKDLKVEFKCNYLSVHTNTTTTNKCLLKGTLAESIQPRECTWMLEDSSAIVVVLEKANANTWWDRLLVTDTEYIDTTLIDSMRHLHTYEDSTQQMIAKLMHQQQQQQQQQQQPPPLP